MKILVIEDCDLTRDALVKEFRKKEIITDEAADGEIGFRKLSTTDADLAIVDLDLPKLPGEKIIERCRAMGVTTPILVLTANQEMRSRISLLKSAVDDYLTKPYSFDELHARITAIMRRKKNDFPNEHLKVECLELVPERQAVLREGKEIPLRRKEYDLLLYFMRHPNRVVDRATLSHEVWGYSEEAISNTVDAHMSVLRSKLDKGFERKILKTIYGLGYCLELGGC